MTLNRREALQGLAIVMTVSLTASKKAFAADKQYRVAYLARAQSDSFAAWLANSMIAAAKMYPDITLTVSDAQSRNDLMQNLVENAVQNKFDLTIIQSIDPELQIDPVRKAMAQGMKFIATNPRFKTDDVPSVDANPYQQGAVNAQYALGLAPKNAQAVVLLGPPGNPHSDGRRDAWKKEFFDKRPDVKIVAEQTANWNKDEALTLMEDWIQSHPQIDLVVSMNDNMAAGAYEAIKAANTKLPQIYGVDGTAEACLLIKDSKMVSTSLQNAQLLAEKCLKMAHDILTGAPTDLHETIEANLIDKDNVDEFISLHKSIGDIK